MSSAALSTSARSNTFNDDDRLFYLFPLGTQVNEHFQNVQSTRIAVPVMKLFTMFASALSKKEIVQVSWLASIRNAAEIDSIYFVAREQIWRSLS